MIRGNGVYYGAEMSELDKGPSPDDLITIKRGDLQGLFDETAHLGAQVSALQARLNTLACSLMAETTPAASTAPVKSPELTPEGQMIQATVRQLLEPLVKYTQHEFEERIDATQLDRPTVPSPPTGPASADPRSDYMYRYGRSVEWRQIGENTTLPPQDTLSYHYTYVPGENIVQAADIAVVRVGQTPEEPGARQKTQIVSLQLTNQELTKLTVENLSQIAGTEVGETVSSTIDLANIRYFERLPRERRACSYTYDPATRLFINDQPGTDLDFPRFKSAQEITESIQESLNGLLALR
jgi:hypothetical protein